MPPTDVNEQQHDQITKKIDDLSIRLDRFLTVYELDMRGDKNVNNGNPGMVGAVRDIRKQLQEHLDEHKTLPTPLTKTDLNLHLEDHEKDRKEYPSFTYLLKNHPASTIAAILTTFVILNALLTAGVLQVILTVFGVPSHTP